jgi:hypothetical protein
MTFGWHRVHLCLSGHAREREQDRQMLLAQIILSGITAGAIYALVALDLS